MAVSPPFALCSQRPLPRPPQPGSPRRAPGPLPQTPLCPNACCLWSVPTVQLSKLRPDRSVAPSELSSALGPLTSRAVMVTFTPALPVATRGGFLSLNDVLSLSGPLASSLPLGHHHFPAPPANLGVSRALPHEFSTRPLKSQPKWPRLHPMKPTEQPGSVDVQPFRLT